MWAPLEKSQLINEDVPFKGIADKLAKKLAKRDSEGCEIDSGESAGSSQISKHFGTP
jgi:hypothetical protein